MSLFWPVTDVLAGRKTTGEIRGRILFAGVKPRGAFLRRYSGYVEQVGEASLSQRISVNSGRISTKTVTLVLCSWEGLPVRDRDRTNGACSLARK